MRETYCKWLERCLKIKSSWTNTNKRRNQMIKEESNRNWLLSLLKKIKENEIVTISAWISANYLLFQHALVETFNHCQKWKKKKCINYACLCICICVWKGWERVNRRNCLAPILRFMCICICIFICAFVREGEVNRRNCLAQILRHQLSGFRFSK